MIILDKRTRTERKIKRIVLCPSVQSESAAYLQNVMLLILNVDKFASHSQLIKLFCSRTLSGLQM